MSQCEVDGMEKLGHGVKLHAPFTVVKKEATNLQCAQCNKTFTRSWLLKNHQRIHTGERPYKCSYCDKAFADKSNLRQHAKIHTTKEKHFQCSICQKTFAQRRYLMKHATEIHRDVTVAMLNDPVKGGNNAGSTRFIIQPPVSSQSASISGKKESNNGKQTVKQKLEEAQKKMEVAQRKNTEETKAAKYSEQDLKDFIKSSHKTMEKNGYIFIKQNFETLDTDTEPTLTEISEVPVQAISDTALKIGDFSKGNQLLKVNGKMVYLQMDNKPATREEILEAAKSNDPNTNVGKAPVTKNTPSVKHVRKNVAKVPFMKKQPAQAKHLRKTEGKVETNQQTMKAISVPNIVKNVMKYANPLQVMAMKQTEPMTLLQVVPDQQIVIPVSMVPVHLGSNVSQVIKTPTIVNLDSSASQQTIINSLAQSGLRISGIPSNIDSNRHVSVFHDSLKTEVVGIQAVEGVDEKGAAGEIGVSSTNPTPIVSDAPWQGVLNINSEQELVEYISAQSNTAVETDQGYTTIFIQNVDAQNGTVLSSLDSQNLLGTGMSSVFTEQGTMISDILPVVSNVEAQESSNTEEEDAEIINPMITDTEEDEDIKTNVIEIRTENVESDSDIVGVENIIKVEIDHDFEESIANEEREHEIMIVADSEGHFIKQTPSPEQETGHLMIKEEVDSEHLDGSEIQEETVVDDEDMDT